MDFSNVESIAINEGDVEKITNSANTIIWQAAPSAEYRIVKNGTTIDNVRMRNFVNKVRDGSAMTDYGYGSQIIIPYVDAVNGTEYELPFNFGTIQEFEKEDGTTFTGLGLQALYGLPTGGIQFDNKEPSNTNSDRKSYGNNRWQYSNLRQWLNKSGKNWYTAAHSADAAPTKPDPTTSNGFLSCLPEDFVNACVAVKNVTKTVNIDGGVLDTTYDKFFPLSLSQINCKCTDTAVGTGDESEGRYWDYWRNITNSTGYLEGAFGDGGSDSNNNRIIYNIENHSTACAWYLRSAFLLSSMFEWYIDVNGCVVYDDARAVKRVAPACVIG